MKKNKGVALLTVLMTILIAVFMVAQLHIDHSLPLCAVLAADGDIESITCWQDENDRVYVFLPSYASPEQVFLRLETSQDVWIADNRVANGMNCAAFTWNEPLELVYQSWGQQVQKTLIFVQSAKVATMYVDTASGNMEYIHSKKNRKETGKLRLYDKMGSLVYAGELSAIGGRGNFTWDNFEKKAYSLTLLEDANLLEMGVASRWVLLANAFDPSHLRNKLVYDFANEIGMPYTPSTQWVDLYLNGEYAGIYLLSERNEIHEQRVDIELENSFLVSSEPIDRLTKQNYPHLQTEAGVALRVHNPIQVTEEEIDSLQDVWQHIENAILAEDGIDPDSGKSWNEWIDENSWATKYLIEETFGSGDACFLSQFYYRDGKDGLVYAGPVWDFDRSMGSKDIWEFEVGQVFVADRLEVKDGYNAPWFYALNRKPEFAARVKELYQQTFLPLLQEYFGSRLSLYAAEVEQAAALNQIRWNVERSVQDEVQIIQAYMADRIDFLSSVWIDEKEYCRVRADHGFGGFYAYYAIEPGACLMELPVFEDTENAHFAGWYYVDSGEPVDLTRPVWEDFKIIARWQETSAKKLDQLLKLLPLGVIACMGAALLLAEIMRWGKAGEKAWRRK